MSSNFAQDLATQSWTLYGIGMFLIAYRTYVHWVLIIQIQKANYFILVLHDGVELEPLANSLQMTGSCAQQ